MRIAVLNGKTKDASSLPSKVTDDGTSFPSVISVVVAQIIRDKDSQRLPITTHVSKGYAPFRQHLVVTLRLDFVTDSCITALIFEVVLPSSGER